VVQTIDIEDSTVDSLHVPTRFVIESNKHQNWSRVTCTRHETGQRRARCAHAQRAATNVRQPAAARGATARRQVSAIRS
jgi:hypothetical protein